MNGENNGSKPYEQMDDLGGFPIILGNAQLISGSMISSNFEHGDLWYDYRSSRKQLKAILDDFLRQRTA